MVEGTIDGFRFHAALEPDGKGSHWFRVDKILREGINAATGETVSVAIEPLEDWPEPEVPEDLQNALADDPQAHDSWKATTTKARWDWIRWIRSTSNPKTRQIRIDKTRSKLRAGERRPCCFNRSLCTEPSVSKGGVLLEDSKPGKSDVGNQIA